jgi:hypothetical protein
MLEGFFCKDTPFPLICMALWNLTVIFFIGFIVYRLFTPKKKKR